MHRSSFLAGILVAASLTAPRAVAEVFVDVGVNGTRIESDIAGRPDTVSTSGAGAHFGIGARRSTGRRGDFGVRLEVDDADGDLMLAVRALDYRRHRSDRIAFTAFLGAARLDLATPAYGYYFGGGVQLKQILPSWDLGVELRFGDKVARDNLLPSDPQGGRPDNFHDVRGLAVYLSYRF
ncbi:MAG TPA: hypothetical protein VF322_16930 [Gammaproteobacteria bacterium]